MPSPVTPSASSIRTPSKGREFVSLLSQLHAKLSGFDEVRHASSFTPSMYAFITPASQPLARYAQWTLPHQADL